MRPDPVSSPSEAWSDIRFSPDARDLFCRDFGLAPTQAEAMLAGTNAELVAAWRAYRATHPGATLRDFGLHEIEQAAFALAIEMGASPPRARRVAQKARAEAAAASPRS